MKPASTDPLAPSLHAEPIGWILRLYDEPDGYESRAPYHTVAFVMSAGRRAWITGMNGRIDRRSRQLIADWIRDQGFESAEMERHGRQVEERRDP